MKQHIFGLALILTLAAAPARAQSSAAGDWELNLETPQGAQTIAFALTVDGEKATGSLTSQLGTMPVNGTIAAGALAVSGNMEIQGMSLPLGVNGQVEGETLNGTIKLGDFGEFPFTGKRAAKTGAAAPAAPAAAPVTGSTTDVTGKWNMTLSLPGMGDLPLSGDFKQEGTEITGTIGVMTGSVPVKGTLTGQAFKIDFTAETPQGPMPVTFNGDLSATGLAGKATIAGLGEADWKAVRAQ
jgi:hypothetical protein